MGHESRAHPGGPRAVGSDFTTTSWLSLRDQLGDRVRIADIRNAGHMIFLEQPDAVAETMISFLREH